MGFFARFSSFLRKEPGPLTFGKYILAEPPIAEGPMSVVYRAATCNGGENVAVKVLKDSAARVAQRLDQLGKQWEGQRAFAMQHPNVVRTLECGCKSGTYFVVMEFIEGALLARLIYDKSQLLQGRRIAIIREIVQGLAYIHGMGLIHRDICPRNVLLDAEGNAKIIDFGVTIDRGDLLRDTGRRTGRPSYMAPELIRDNVFDVRTDLYALGVSMYELCTGAKPLSGTDRYEKMRQNLYVTPTPPAEINPSVPLALNNATMRCLAKDPDKRFQTVEELLENLPADGSDTF